MQTNRNQTLCSTLQSGVLSVIDTRNRYRNLAHNVLKVALQDLTSTRKSAREEAYLFFFSSAPEDFNDRHYWIEMAGLCHSRIESLLQQLNVKVANLKDQYKGLFK